MKQIPKIDILYIPDIQEKKNKKTTESVIFRLYSKDIVKLGIKTKYHRLRRFLVFFLNIRNTRCLFSFYFVLP